MASEAVAVAVAALDSDSVFIEYGTIRHLLIGWGSLNAEKKAHVVVDIGLLVKAMCGLCDLSFFILF
jgi:hypothetical protein